MKPRTSRRLPAIEPTSEAFTISVRPLESATIAMMSSGAFPNVAFRKPPIPGTGVTGKVVRRLADQPRERDERRGRQHEQRQRAGGIEPVQHDHERTQQQ